MKVVSESDPLMLGFGMLGICPGSVFYVRPVRTTCSAALHRTGFFFFDAQDSFFSDSCLTRAGCDLVLCQTA